ncbi:MAG TPA: ATP-binding protein [Thermoguttaceae bacterium]|nr:ATP-binding protein [Thermoguttaceae bacterium]
MTHSQAHLIEAIAEREQLHLHQHDDTPGWDPREATLETIRTFHNEFRGFGTTGEFMLAEHDKENDKIVPLFGYRYLERANPEPVPFSSTLAEPMRRALSNKAGTLIGLDYRGHRVLAAHEPLKAFDGMGIVAKIDLSEIRAPFVRAGLLAGGWAVGLSLLGMVCFLRVGHPIVRRVDESERRYRDLFESAELRVVERTADLTKANQTLRREVEERKRAEATVREQAELLESFFKYTLDGIVLLDKDFNFIRVNEPYARTDCREVSDFPGHNHFEFYPSDAQAIFENVVATKQPFEVHSRPFVFPDHPEWGETYWDWTLVPILDEHGDVHRLIFTLKDVTERKRLEQMQNQLAHMARVSTVGEMVASIAHEVNQPLYSIRNFAKASANVLANEEQADLGNLREWNTAISKSAVRAAEIIKRLRRFVRRTESARSTCRIDEILEESIGLLAFEARRCKVDVRCNLSEASLIVLADRVEIQQVVVNLLQNAYEAIDEADVPVREVTVRAASDGQFVEVSIADTGPGLPPDNQLQIFSPFVTTKKNGLGMGLAIATTIVDAHGGKLWATSNSDMSNGDGGATFRFTLPLVQKGPQDREGSAADA